jgi:hypothetical protein
MRWDVSLGNLITIATVIIGLSAGWTQLKADQANIQRDQNRLEQAMANRLQALEQERIVTAQMLAEIRTDARWTRQAVERLEQERVKR